MYSDFTIFTIYNIFTITNIKYHWDKAQEVGTEYRNSDVK